MATGRLPEIAGSYCAPLPAVVMYGDADRACGRKRPRCDGRHQFLHAGFFSGFQPLLFPSHLSGLSARPHVSWHARNSG